MDVQVEEFENCSGKEKEMVVNVYDLEPHLQKRENLARHNRFYQAKIDSRYMSSGEDDFSILPNLYVITITDFDPFGENYMMYTVQNHCLEVPSMKYEDGVQFVYFYTRGQKGGSQELQELLRYLQNSTEQNVRNETIRKIHGFVNQVKVSPEVKQEYMTFEHYVPKSAWVVYALLLASMTIFSILYPKTTLTIGNNSWSAYIIPVITVSFALLGFLSLRKTVHNFILILLTYTIIYLIVGVMGYQWYIMEIASLFLVMGIASGLATGKNGSEIAGLFIEGMSDILSAAVVVGLAGGIVIILQDGGIIDTILFNLSKTMADFGKIASIEIMYGIQTIINIVIPSGSAKAAITMPIMAPFSDLIGICRQATVMAFQFGDGFTNMITPTSGVLIAALGVARIPYQKWVRWVWKLILTLIILGGLLLIPTVLMNLKGF